jgi:hypothetical protein
MTNADLFLELRQELGDMGNVYSYFDITRAINFVYRIINNFLPRTSPDVKATTTLTITDGSATLPTDLAAIQSVWSGTVELYPNIGQETLDYMHYEVRGSTLYTGASGSLTLYYKKQFTAVTPADPPTGDCPLPDMFAPYIVKYAKMYLQGASQADVIIPSIEKDVKILGAVRDKSKIVPRMSFYV